MIVTCPNCETKFEIPDDKYRPGRKARCSNCGFVFVLPELEEATPEQPAAAPDDFPNDIAAETAAPAPETAAPTPDEAPGETSGEIPGEPSGETADNPPGDAAGEASAEGEADPATAGAPASVDDAVFDPQEKKAAPKGKKSKKNLLIILGAALVVVLLGYGGYKVVTAFFLSGGGGDPKRVTDGRTASSLGGTVSEADKEKEAARQAATRRLSLSAPQQYIEKGNKSTGPIIVIAGSVTNNFDTPKSLVLLEITLFDDKGRPLVVREQYCGVTLQPLHLQTLSKEALEKALNNQVVILTNNTDILPGASVPFMALFFGYPDAAYEFEIKIVDVQDSAPAR